MGEELGRGEGGKGREEGEGRELVESSQADDVISYTNWLD